MNNYILLSQKYTLFSPGGRGGGSYMEWEGIAFTYHFSTLRKHLTLFFFPISIYCWVSGICFDVASEQMWNMPFFAMSTK